MRVDSHRMEGYFWSREKAVQIRHPRSFYWDIVMNINHLPTLVAQPYHHSLEESMQRKDYQYYTLEYSLGVLSGIVLSCILQEHQIVQEGDPSSAIEKQKKGPQYPSEFDCGYRTDVHGQVDGAGTGRYKSYQKIQCVPSDSTIVPSSSGFQTPFSQSEQCTHSEEK